MSDELLNQDLLLDVEGHGRRVGANDEAPKEDEVEGHGRRVGVHDDTNDDDEVEGHARRVG